MKNSLKNTTNNHHENLEAAWKNISPFWPLENLIACNPLRGFENLPFEDSLKEVARFFEQEFIPKEIEDINLMFRLQKT